MQTKEEKLEYQRKWRAANKDKANAYSRAWKQRNPEAHAKWRVENPEKQKAAQRRWAENNPEKVKAKYLRAKYGLEYTDYLLMLEKGCEVCGSFTDLNVDHDHATGVVRGMLCRKCNYALGHCSDSPVLLRALAAWLEGKNNDSIQSRGKA